MGRKYKRDNRGRFAGGGGGGASRKSTTGGGGKRTVAKNGSKAMAKSKPKLSAGARFKKGAQKSAKFAAKNPRLVLGVAYGATVAAQYASNKRRNKANPQFGMHDALKYAEGVASSKRGIGGKPGAGLKMAQRTRLRKVHKIRSGI